MKIQYVSRISKITDTGWTLDHHFSQMYLVMMNQATFYKNAPRQCHARSTKTNVRHRQSTCRKTLGYIRDTRDEL